MIRWRKVKQNKKDVKIFEQKINQASFLDRLKAYIIDFFMLYVPVIYFFGYIVYDGKEDFKSSQVAPFLVVLVYGIITILFWIKNGQTPGKKAYNLKLIDEKNSKLLSFPKAIFRFIMFLVSATSFIGVLLPLIRKDKKAFHDLITKSVVVYDK
jgi:uncharacterized RDD family membrane protein YckC